MSGLRMLADAVFGNGDPKDKRIAELEARIAGLEAARIAYASEFEPDPEGEPDVGNIHANIRALKAQLSTEKLAGEILSALPSEFPIGSTDHEGRAAAYYSQDGKFPPNIRLYSAQKP